MTNIEIIERLARAKTVEKVIEKVVGKVENEFEDLAQDVYMSLLLDHKLQGIYERKQIMFYISRIIMNNIASNTSPFYRRYILPLKNSEPFNLKQHSNIADTDIWR